MAWYDFLLEFIAGLLLANGVPHFVQGICGHPFQTPFARPPGVGESPPIVNVVWGFANLACGAVLLRFFGPRGASAFFGWAAVAVGSFAIAIMLAIHFGKVRAGRHPG
jgi:hypothetical protein